jgi:transcriptional regulator with XRE-family HTH domain
MGIAARGLKVHADVSDDMARTDPAVPRALRCRSCMANGDGPGGSTRGSSARWIAPPARAQLDPHGIGSGGGIGSTRDPVSPAKGQMMPLAQDGGMPGRLGPVRVGRERGRRLSEELRRELRDARVDRGLSQARVGAAIGWDQSRVSRFEAGRLRVDIEQAAVLCAVVGLELSLRAYPAGPPIRDAAHLALLGRLRATCDPRLVWRTEVPLPGAGDPRAWDAMIGSAPGSTPRWWIPVEAETRPRDVQALLRRLALKARDGRTEAVILVLARTSGNRDVARRLNALDPGRFTVPPRHALAALAAGGHPGGSTLILL